MLKKFLNKKSKYIISILALISVLCFALFSFKSKMYAKNTPECNVSLPLSSYVNLNSNAGCLIVKDDKVLFVKLARSNKITIPGGKGKKGENSSCTAHRETFEETGLNVKVIKKILTAENGFEIFLCETSQEIDKNYKRKYEIKAVFYAKPENIKNYKYPQQLKEIKNFLKS